MNLKQVRSNPNKLIRYCGKVFRILGTIARDGGKRALLVAEFMTKAKRKTLDGKTVKVDVLSMKEQQALTREKLQQRARTVSQGGTRPNNMSREEWRTSQGSFYDDDRC